MRNKILNKLVLPSIFFFSVAIQPQSLNEDFLQSLPSNLQEELMLSQSAEFDSKQLNLNPETRLKLMDESLSNIKQQISNLESRISSEQGDNQEDLIVFGSDFFTTFQSTFSPINVPNQSASYIIDVGDVLNFQILGTNSRTRDLQVGRDGFINVTSIGKIYVAGMSLNNAIEIIKNESRSRLSVEVSVTLSKMRDMSIMAIGNVNNPGIYTLSGGSNILSVLIAAGGISDKGSFRSITHKRNNQIVQVYDLYDLLIDGNFELEKPIRSGDVIIVEGVNKQVSISGGVNKPAIYELLDNENLNDLINFSLGLSPNAQTDQITFIQSDGSRIKNKLDNYLLDGVVSIFIPLYKPENLKTNTVKITGAVKKPGIYDFEDGEKLSKLIEKAGGYTTTAYVDAGKLFRRNVAEIEKEVFDRAYREIVNFLAANSALASQVQPGTLQATLAELKNAKPKGRLSAEFNLYKIKQDNNLDTVLLDGDIIDIPQYSSEVFVLGEIQNQGAYTYKPQSSIKDYVKQAGGYGRFADKDNIILIFPNGEAFNTRNSLGLLSMAGTSKDIIPGTIIYAARDIGKIEGINLAATVAPIVSSLALSLASLNSIND